MSRVKKLSKEYSVINPKGESKAWAADDFWKMVMQKDHPENREEMGYLVSQFDFDQDWKSWEKHPKGDEIVFCISGSFDFILDLESGEEVSRVNPGEYVVVPKDTWHRARVLEPAKALFITWGHGTEHKDV